MGKLSQAVGVLGIVLLLGMVAHKGHADISVLAQNHSGSEFWVELGRYLIRNLAGGGSSGADTSSRRP